MQVRAHADLPVNTRSSVAISDNQWVKTLFLARISATWTLLLVRF